jgi:alpha-ketoglutarate-dependent taurine dioxygenase
MHVKSVARMTPFETANFASLLNRHGAAVLVPVEDPDDGLAAYSTLDRLLGTSVKHDQMNEHGIVEINPSRPTSINTANPQKPHLPHTDDAYTDQPSQFITLQCRQAAPSGGGETVLMSGVELLAALDSEELRSFMRPGLVSMGRRPAADGSWMQVSSIPMFWINQESGWLQLRWRCNDGCVQDVHEDAKNVYQRMDSVARGKVNQLVVNLAPKEIIVVDNRAVAHGRRTYDENEPRIMWRKNYVGDGQLAASLNVGMLQGFSSVLGDCSSIFDPATWEGDDPRVQ